MKRINNLRRETADLFVDLFAYRQRENKDPLEDWLTECLAVTIRALPLEAKAKFLSDVSGVDIPESADFFAKHDVEIHTQYLAGGAGRPDMLILIDGCPWILFENKVGHGVSAREGTDGEQIHQLRRYAGWLDVHGRDCPYDRTLLFVTHITPPPPDFRGADAAQLYHGLRRAHVSWGALGRGLSELTDDLPEHHHAKAMADAFLTYLESRNMSNEFPASADFAAAELYVTQAENLENLVGRMWAELKIVTNFGRTADVIIKALTEEGSVSAWRYIAPGASSGRDCFVQTGIWFPETGLWEDMAEVEAEFRGAQAYIFFGSAWDDVFAGVDEAPDGYVRPKSNFLLCRPIAEFSADPQVRGEEIISWVAMQAQRLKRFLVERKLIS